MKINFYRGKAVVGFVEINTFNTVTASTFIDALKKTDLKSSTHNHSINRNKIEIINDFLRLKEIVGLINSSSYDKKIEVDLKQEFSIQKLFDLHEHFEHLGERKRSNDPTLVASSYEEIINLGCEMNGLIHKLEGSLYGGHWVQALFKKPEIIRIPLTDEIIAEATKGYKKNTLYVGYGETGKNMAHIYAQNEVELLERKMVQPQRYILTEFFLSLSNKMLDYKDYKDWCLKNNAKDYGYDYENPIWYGTWPIGEIVGASFQGLQNFPVYDSICVEI